VCRSSLLVQGGSLRSPAAVRGLARCGQVLAIALGPLRSQPRAFRLNGAAGTAPPCELRLGVQVLPVSQIPLAASPETKGEKAFRCCVRRSGGTGVTDQGLGCLLQLHPLLLGQPEQRGEGVVSAAVVLCHEDALSFADHCA